MRLRRPSLFAVLLTLFGIAAFVALGIWQLRRADFKEELLARFTHASSAPLQSFAAVEQRVASDAAYPHVQAHGRFESHRVYFLDDQMHADQLGVDVFVPFVPDNRDRVLLVNFGFLPREGVQQALPDLPPIPSAEVTLQGIYTPPPPPGLKLGGDQLAHEKAWPKTTTFIDMRAIGDDLRRTLYPRVLLLDTDPATPYVRQWTPDTMPPAQHRAYALQWFTFALAALVIFVVMHRVRDDQPPAPDKD